MVGQIGQLSFKLKPVLFIFHQLVHGGIAIWVNSVIVWVHQVTLDVAKSFQLDSCQFLHACSGAHGRILGPVDEFTDREYCYNA